MKYIKSYKIYESSETDDIIVVLKDMTLDLTDNDFTVDVSSLKNSIKVNIKKYSNKMPGSNSFLTFHIDEIKDVLNQIIEFMSDNEYSIHLMAFSYSVGRMIQLDVKNGKIVDKNLATFSTQKELDSFEFMTIRCLSNFGDYSNSSIKPYSLII